MSSRSCSAPTRATSTATTSSSTAVSAETSSAACRASPRSRADETISLRRTDTMGKKLLFVGAGAIGSYLGAFLSRAGHDVTLVDPWADQVETIRERGISVTGPHEPFEARPSAVHLHEAARLDHDYEIAFVAMKVYDTPWATQLALRHLAPDGYVVAAQNCWPDPMVAAIAGASRAVGLVMSKIGVALWKPGQVERGLEKGQSKGHDVFRVGEHVPKSNGAEAAEWAGAERPETYDALDRMLTPASARPVNWRASMAQDVAKGRPTEIDHMNGSVVARGRARGVPTPVSEAVVEVMHEVDARTRKPAPENIELALRRVGL